MSFVDTFVRVITEHSEFTSCMHVQLKEEFLSDTVVAHELNHKIVTKLVCQVI